MDRESRDILSALVTWIRRTLEPILGRQDATPALVPVREPTRWEIQEYLRRRRNR